LPSVRVVFYREEDGSVPVLEWLDRLPDKARDKCVARIERLADLGYELRRPECDYLEEGIYELRSRFQRVHYRLLYFFSNEAVVVLAHGATKEQRVSPKDIEVCIRRKVLFEANPRLHSAKL